MKMSRVLGGKRLKAQDLGPNAHATVKIDAVRMESCGNDKKPVMYFAGHERGLVLNITNVKTLTDLFGTDESDDWIGRQIELFTTGVLYQNKEVLGIRVRGLTRPARAAQPQRVVERTPGEDDGMVEAGDIQWSGRSTRW